MSSQDSAKPRASIDSLSKELLHRVVALVDEQDRSVAESGVSLASEAPSSTTSRSGVTKLPEGKLSWWYAHGVSALSLVNRRLREVALPLLCRSIKATQLSKPIFQFSRIPAGLLAGIETLDFAGADLDSYAAAAIALDQLKSLHEIRLSGHDNERVNWRVRVEGKARNTQDDRDSLMWANEAFSATVERFTALRYHCPPFCENFSQVMQRFTRPPILRKLVYSTESTHCSLHETLRACTQLEELDLSNAKFSFASLLVYDATSELQLELPRLTSLVSRCNDLKSIRNLGTFASSLRRLSLRLADIRQGTSIEAIATKIALPHLEVLELSGYSSCAKALSSFDIPALKKLELSITRSQSPRLDCAAFLPADFAPPAGLDFHLATHRLLTLDSFDSLQDRCTAQGMRFSHRYLAVLAPFEPRSTDVAEPVDEPSEARKEALLETISWAEEHLEKVWDEGDVQGLQELAEAMKMVAQRKQLDTL
ncbi:hypothetical protein Rhopal_004251-T1 [Rhodotorula paludigena]|uniref:Proteophosphoglycan ppg4 n=1 Tax=Rhodotorula paludigena TaxID=86838 RepID=A0AAV5GLZ8_9BASI|nr:hypothetical protein Rhopal_004251-T1 [Rhodotorula paludigena]